MIKNTRFWTNIFSIKWIISILLLFNFESLHSQIKLIKSVSQNPELKRLAIRVANNPNSLKTNQNFIDAVDMMDSRPLLTPQYEIWIKRFPNAAQLQFAIGKEYYERGYPEADYYLNLALQINPKLAEARRFLVANQPEQAEEIIQKVKLGQFIGAQETLLLLKTEIAHANGNTQAAYDSLTVYYSKTPVDDVRTALFSYGKKLGKDTISIMNEISALRNRVAIPATPFTLTSYLSGEKVSLNDFKGKVVLISYFYPACPPCRKEFPHVESVLKKLKSDEVVYLGINVEPLQDDIVLSFVKSNNYSFIPLKDNWTRNKGNLAAHEVPKNYLIDQQGRIQFSDFQIDNENERSLELMISELLGAEMALAEE